MKNQLKITGEFEVVKNKKARNRIVMPPMDTTMANNGYVNDFHIQHYGSRSFGGVGTIIVETTAVLENGRIVDKDLGIWNDSYVKGLSQLVNIIKQGGAIAGIQLTHAGAKSELVNLKKYGTTTKYFNHLDQSQLVLIDDKIAQEIEQAFVDAALRAKNAGFDFVELHGAHGYLLSCLMSKLANEIIFSEDIIARSQLVINVVRRINEEVKIPVGIRISFNDHLDEGMKVEEFKPLILELEKYVDYFHVSSGHTIVSDSKSYIRVAKFFKVNVNKAMNTSMKYVPRSIKLFRVPIATKVKKWTSKNIIVVGNFYDRKDINFALKRKIDAVSLGRELLLNPNVVVNNLLKPKELTEDKYSWVQNPWFSYGSYRKWKNR